MIPKFRAWHKKTKEMFEVAAICFVEVGWHELSTQFCPYAWVYRENSHNMQSKRPLKDLTLMQWTGLTDKNGKKIYEGDIVVSGYNVLFQDVIEWDESTASFRGVFNDPNYTLPQKDILDSSWYKDSYVIGNIYENPDLLENKE